MLEIILLIYTLKSIHPLAKDQGRSGAVWVLLGLAVWFSVEILIITFFVIIFVIGHELFGWPDLLESPLFFLIYIIALAGAFFSTDFLRRYLEKKSLEDINKQGPPEPPLFSSWGK